MSLGREHICAFQNTTLDVQHAFMKGTKPFRVFPYNRFVEDIVIPFLPGEIIAPRDKVACQKVPQLVSRPGLDARALDSLDNILLRRLPLLLLSKNDPFRKSNKSAYHPRCQTSAICLVLHDFSVLHSSKLTIHQRRRESKNCHLQKLASICTVEQILSQ